MKEIYSKLWELAKPYYEKGRPTDIEHIEWMMDKASLVCEQENLDDSILMPLVILHDVGYGQIKVEVVFKEETRKAHMERGSKIARLILENLNYPKDKREVIINHISVHDNWAIGDNSVYKADLILSVFNDLDYIWMATPKGFAILMKMLKKNPSQMLDFLATNDKPKLRPFATKTTRELYETYIGERITEVSYSS